MKAVVLFSGGLDSLATALVARHEDPLLLHLAYGQRQARAEAHAAGELAVVLGLRIRYLDALALSAARQAGDVLPGRNLAFLAIAAGLAHSQGAEAVYIGTCGADDAGFPDCRPAFLEAAARALALGGVPVAVKAPLVGKTKAETFAMIAAAGLLDRALATTHTCYEGNHHDQHAWGFGCGACAACTTRAAGWAAFTG